MVVGEAFLSAFLGVLFDRLACPQLLEFARREGLEAKLKKLRKMLSRTQTVLDDAEEKQYDNVDVKEWLDDLKDFANDAEDMLDEFATEALHPNLHVSTGEARNPICGMVANFTQSIVEVFTQSGGLQSKIKEITIRFDDLVQRKDELNLKEIDGRGSERKRKRETLEPTSVPTEPCVYGRERETEELLQLLLSEKNSEGGVSVITILGMGGIGKTTLAQVLYNHEKVQSAFQLKAWVYVSEDFDTVRVTKAILRSVNSEINVGDNLNLLQVELRKELNDKKFLVILDDLWNENYHKWESLYAPFHVGAPGSRIVLTTRHQEVASAVGTSTVYPLQEFSNDACFSLFTQHALRASDFRAHPNLKDIGKKIVKKCKGLPLAAKTLGGLLCTRRNRDEWEEVLNSEIWDIEENRGGILPYLMLSYHHLPSHLKRCFQFCSIFSKGYEFEEEELVLLWMAEGLIQPHPNKKPEVLGIQYFRSLLSRSFFQKSTASNSRFLMHDFINDLAQFVARDTCCRLEDTVNGGEKFPERARHLSYLVGKYEDAKKFEALSKLTRLRTFLPLKQAFTKCYLSYNVLNSLLDLPYLRVLSLRGLNIAELPDSIGHLKLLRYLDLSFTAIEGLPESTTMLYKLQTLILKDCSELKKLTSIFGNLVNLRHLNISSSNLEGMPPQIGNLTYLQTLSNFMVGKNNYANIKELRLLLHLQGKLKISKLENVIEPMDAWEANLIDKAKLDELELEWSSSSEVSQENPSVMKVLNMLQPHKSLKRLTLMGYGGTRFSSWLSDPSYVHMVSLSMIKCKKCTSLPSIGQLPSLEFLKISKLDSVKDIGLEFYGERSTKSFRSLKMLHFEDMKEWKNWIHYGEFQYLSVLSIQNCSKLVGKVPNQLPSLEQVIINGCEQLDISISGFPNSCKVEFEGSEGVVCEKKVHFSLLRFKFMTQIERLNSKELTTIEKLIIWGCEDLMPLWSSEVGLLQYFPYLHFLKIGECPRLISLVTKEVEVQIRQGMPSALRHIEIWNCNALESLPQALMYNQTCLQEINIFKCNSLRRFAIGQLPPTLKVLSIMDCANLLILLDKDVIQSGKSSKPVLKDLTIGRCPSLKSITSSGQLPAAKWLYIISCQNLKSIGDRFEGNSPLEAIDISCCENLKSLPMGMHNLSHLERISLENCPSLVCFPDREFLPTNLRELRILRCEKIQGVPNCIHSLTSLRHLLIWECSGIVSFPEKGFPFHLTTLAICNVNMNEAVLEWGLEKLNCLERLDITSGSLDLVSFPKGLLPASLTSLTIGYLPNLIDLSSKAFRILKSLEDLRIEWCTKLASFPEDGLPRSLKRLDIYRCPLLTEHCEKDKGREWHKLTHVPYVIIDKRLIHGPAFY